MNKGLKILSVLLVLQIFLVLWVNWRRDNLGAFSSEQRLLALDVAQVDGIEIVETGHGSLTIKRKEGKWVLPEEGDFPAAAEKVKGALERLAELNRSWPVASTEIAARQLKAAETDYEKKLRLSSGDSELAVLYLGTSPSFRRLHARVKGQEPVYAVSLNSYDFGISPGDWRDRAALQIRREDLKSLAALDLVFEYSEAGWKLRDLSAEEETNAAELNKVLSALGGLSFTEVLSAADKAEDDLAQPKAVIRAVTNTGEEIELVIAKPAESDKYIVKSSVLPFYFEVAEFAVQELLNWERSRFVQAKAAETDA